MGGKGKFHLTPYIPPPEVPDEEFPLLLTTGRILYHYHSVISRKSKPLSEMAPAPTVDISPEDARKLDIGEDGDMVSVESRRGHVEARARIVD